MDDLIEFAKGLGATDARIITTKYLFVCESVRLKCRVPFCPNYNRCYNCPPHLPSVAEFKKIIESYDKAIVFKVDLPDSEDFTDVKRYYPHGQKYQKLVDEIASKLESYVAEKKGYYLAMGFGSGGCRDTLCNGQDCSMIKFGVCPNILKARPSMEAMGIDVFRTCSRIGWEELQPILRCSETPATKAAGVGMVLLK